MNVSVTPTKSHYGPGDTVELSVRTTRGDNGMPVSAVLGVSVVDETVIQVTTITVHSYLYVSWLVS